MQIRKLVVSASAVALAIAAMPAQARVGVEEDGGTPSSHATVAAPESEGGGASGMTAGYDEREGGFFLKSANGDNKLVVGGRFQARYDGIAWDDDLGIDNTSTFQIRRARLYFLGNLMGKQNTYFVQVGADGPDQYYTSAIDNGSLEVYDAWMKHQCSEGFGIKLGQFKVPFSRQFLTSSGKLQFPDRSLATTALTLGDLGFDFRDVGTEASGGFSNGKFQYAAALVNGDGRGLANVDNNLAFYGRMSVNPTGDYGYAEGDLDESDTLASTFGFAIHYQKEIPGTDTDVTRYNLDGGIKKAGASIQGEVYVVDFSQSHEGLGADATQKGYYLQGGYFIKPQKLELVARASQVLLEADENDSSEFGVGVNYFMMGHRLKWQAAYEFYDDETLDGVNHHRFIGAGQFWF